MMLLLALLLATGPAAPKLPEVVTPVPAKQADASAKAATTPGLPAQTGSMICVAAPCVWQAKPGKPLQCKPLLPNLPLCPPGYTFDNAEWNVPDKNLIFVWGACCPARPSNK